MLRIPVIWLHLEIIDDTFCSFNHVIELQEMCKQNKKYIKYQTILNKNKNYQKIYWQIGEISVILNQQKEIRKEQK